MAKLFQKPSLQEVLDHILYKMPQWPGSFSEWYAEKFWNHYQAAGWRLSSNVLMKDWKAAFSSNWRDLRFQSDRDKLEEFRKTEAPISPVLIDMEKKVQELFEKYRSGRVDRDGMAACYKWLKANEYIRFTQAEVDKLVADAGNDKGYGRYLSVKLYFNKLLHDKQGNNPLAGSQTAGTL